MAIMNKQITIGSVSGNDEIRPGYVLMTIHVHRSFPEPRPGQFVMIRIAGLQEPFLSRPLSIFSFSRGRSHGLVKLLYRVAGKGTQILAGLIRGSQVEIVGPLGKGYRGSITGKPCADCRGHRRGASVAFGAASLPTVGPRRKSRCRVSGREDGG